MPSHIIWPKVLHLTVVIFLICLYSDTAACWSVNAIAFSSKPITANRPRRRVVDPKPFKERKLVATIGAGAAGSSVAYHLDQILKENSNFEVKVDVLEQAWTVGGRVKTEYYNGVPNDDFDVAAATFSRNSETLLAAANKLGLKVKDTCYICPPRNEFGPDNHGSLGRLTESLSRWWRLTKSIWHHGQSPMRARSLGNHLENQLKDPRKLTSLPFKNLTRFAEERDLIKLTNLTGDDYLRSHGVDPNYTAAIIQANIRNRYAQDISQLHGLQTLLYSDTDRQVSIDGGHWALLDRMLKSSGASIHEQTLATRIERRSGGPFLVDTLTTNPRISDRRIQRTTMYDAVVIAAPFHLSSITVEPPLPHPPRNFSYTSLHITHFSSRKPLNISSIHTAVAGSLLTALLPTTSDPSHAKPPAIYSLTNSAQIAVLDGCVPVPQPLYRVLSAHRLRHRHLKGLFVDGHRGDMINWVHRQHWPYAFPNTGPQADFDGPVLVDGLYYTSGVEALASSLEMSAWMGKNVARLIVEQFSGRGDGECDHDGKGMGVREL
ncbi:MAG: hypothetical protein M1833_002841 [Piccolia ochrophora]|nr:MAG: hypothetical protein M1833_002841 [Piccolia ochrophora]